MAAVTLSHPKMMTDTEVNARELAEVMLGSGRPAEWVLLMVAAYFGPQGRDAALGVIEAKQDLVVK
jgi:hypothetical protein